MPARARLSVRGMGVADSVSTSTSRFSCLSRSFAATPKRCSSSTTTRPRSLNCTSFESRRWVPMTISTVPSARPWSVAVWAAGATKRDSRRTSIGKAPNRCENVALCWAARTVVGTSTATCLPSWTALNAARSATSVLPYPTSPTTRRSIGRISSMSDLTSMAARSWSTVSSYGNEASISACHGVSSPKAWPLAPARTA